MFKTKYTITLLNSKWSVIKNKVKVIVIPRNGEYIYLDEQYYEVLNVVHSIDENQNIFVIINEISTKPNN